MVLLNHVLFPHTGLKGNLFVLIVKMYRVLFLMQNTGTLSTLSANLAAI